MESKYTKIETVVPIVPHTIKADLTPGLGKDFSSTDASASRLIVHLQCV